MAKPRNQFDAEHEAFRKRLQAINASPVGIAARDAMNALRAAYRNAALEHWRELGNRASTGWHSTPEGDYQTPQPVERCANSVTDRLAHHFSQNPNDPPGSRKGM